VPHPNQLPPWSRVFPEKITGPQVVKIFHAFCGTRRFITAFQSVRHPLLLLNQRISPSPRPRKMFRNIVRFYVEELLAPRPTTKLEDHALSAVRECLSLIQYICSYPPYWRSFLHPQLEGAPCYENRDACIMVTPFVREYQSHYVLPTFDQVSRSSAILKMIVRQNGIITVPSCSCMTPPTIYTCMSGGEICRRMVQVYFMRDMLLPVASVKLAEGCFSCLVGSVLFMSAQFRV